jgi:monoamine oxidase
LLYPLSYEGNPSILADSAGLPCLTSAVAPFEITGVHVTTWNLDPWTGGPYSTLRVGGRPHDRTQLLQPIDGRLVFAGEHTNAEFPATMHGAWNSGQSAVANLIAEHFSRVASSTHHTSAPPTAIVVGAGLAGLSAATALRAAGYVVTVVEATSHLGGRARTETVWDSPTSTGVQIHPGAAWIHGSDGNPIATFARAADVEFAPWPEGPIRHVQRGRGDLSSAAVATITAERARVDDLLAAASAVARNTGATDATDTATADTALRIALDSALMTVADLSVRAALATQYSHHFESLMAGDLDDLSLRHGDEPYSYPGGDEYLSTVMAPMLTFLAHGLDVRYGQAVKRVELVDEDETFDNVRVHTTVAASGEIDVFVADVCVVTVPLGHLQAGRIVFDPPLPASHLRSLSMLKMGQKAKVFVRFSERWWGDAVELWSYPATPSADGITRWPLWVDVSRPLGAPALCAFLGGPEARRIQELFADGPAGRSTVEAELRSALRSFVVEL